MYKKTIIALLCAISLIAGTAWVFAGSADPKVPVINRPVSGKNTVDFLDEDDLTTDSAAAVASQQSIRAYVDEQRSLVVDTEAEAEAGSYSYNVYFIDTVGFAGHTDTDVTGVSFYMPTGSEARDGFKFIAMNISESGTTDILFVAQDDAVFGSGVTDGIWTDQAESSGGVTRQVDGGSVPAYIYDVNDVKGEMLEFTYVWATGGGTWYQTDRK